MASEHAAAIGIAAGIVAGVAVLTVTAPLYVTGPTPLILAGFTMIAVGLPVTAIAAAQAAVPARSRA